eukprot:1142545-Rhodomonas_salina.2
MIPGLFQNTGRYPKSKLILEINVSRFILFSGLGLRWALDVTMKISESGRTAGREGTIALTRGSTHIWIRMDGLLEYPWGSTRNVPASHKARNGILTATFQSPDVPRICHPSLPLAEQDV